MRKIFAKLTHTLPCLPHQKKKQKPAFLDFSGRACWKKEKYVLWIQKLSKPRNQHGKFLCSNNKMSFQFSIQAPLESGPGWCKIKRKVSSLICYVWKCVCPYPVIVVIQFANPNVAALCLLNSSVTNATHTGRTSVCHRNALQVSRTSGHQDFRTPVAFAARFAFWFCAFGMRVENRTCLFFIIKESHP